MIKTWSTETWRKGTHYGNIGRKAILGQEWSICKGPEAGVGFPGAQMVKNLPARQETLVRSLGWKYPLEKGTATHSCILAWRSPQTEEPGGLWSVGLQTVGHDWATNTSLSLRPGVGLAGLKDTEGVSVVRAEWARRGQGLGVMGPRLGARAGMSLAVILVFILR